MADQPERNFIFRIFDHFDPESKYKLSVPFEYANSIRFRTDHEATGADFGLIYIPEFYQRQMEAILQTPIDERNWKLDMDFEPAAHLIIGIPNEVASPVNGMVVGRDTTNYQKFEVVALRVKHIPEPPPNIPRYEYPTFWAELWGADLKSIKGMSGCPILAFGKNNEGEVKYGVMAVQSGWFYDRMPRIIYASDFEALMEDAEAFFGESSQH